MPMSSKELHALVSRESEKKDERRRPPLRFYDVVGKYADKKDLPSVEVTAEDEEALDAAKAFAREQEELEATYPTPSDEEE